MTSIRGVVSIVVCLSLMLVPLLAFADTPTSDVTIRQEQNASSDDATSPVAAQPAQAAVEPAPVVETPPVALPTTPTQTQRGMPRLHIDADRPGVRLLRIEKAMSDDMGEGILVRDVCRAPCDQVIDAKRGQTFFFGADGMVPSRGFKLSKIEGDVTARVDGGSIVGRQLGFLFGGFGGAALIGGTVMLAAGYGGAGTQIDADGKIVEGSSQNLTTGGAIVLGAGAALVATAIVLVVTNKTKISLFQDEKKSARVTFELGKLTF